MFCEYSKHETNIVGLVKFKNDNNQEDFRLKRS